MMLTERECNLLDRLEEAGLRGFCLQFCAEQGVSLALVLGLSRAPSVVRVRHHLWFVVLGTLGMSQSEVARLFGVDPSTVNQAIRSQEERAAREAA
jgi:hypothetical protein